MQPNHDLPSPGQPPPGYIQVLYWRISEKLSRVLLINLLSIPFLVLWGSVFFRLASAISSTHPAAEDSTSLNLLPFLMALLLTPVLHELVHGLSMRIFGARPKYGFLWKLLAFYATSPGYAYPRWQYLTIALAPLVVLSLAAVVLMLLLAGSGLVTVIAITATLNATGATGDVWMAALVLRYPPYAYMMDERDGVRIFLPGEENPSA